MIRLFFAFGLLGWLLLVRPARGESPAAPPAAPATPPAAASVIDADEIEFTSGDTEAQFVFSGNVRVEATNLRVTCTRMEITSARTGDAEAVLGQLGQIRFILATGDVTIVQEGRKATAERAELEPEKGVIRLIGSVVVEDPGGFTVLGDEIQLLRGVRQARVLRGRVLAPVLPNMGFPAQEPPPAAPSAPARSPDGGS